MTTDAASIKSQLQQLPDLPASVQSWRVEEGNDWMDEPAVWVWALTEQDDVDGETREQLKMVVRDVVSDMTGGLWAYVLVHGVVEDAPPP